MTDLPFGLSAAAAWDDPAFTFALALGAGVVAQAVAHHARLPGIVLFLATGVLLGPDLLNVVRPDTPGRGLDALVGLAVAVILFEGGLNLDIGRRGTGGKRAAPAHRSQLGARALARVRTGRVLLVAPHPVR